MTRTARLGTLVTAAVLGLVAYLATPASADATDHDPPIPREAPDGTDLPEGVDASMLLKTDPAPRCVQTNQRSDFWGKYTDVKNLCGATTRVKVIVAWGFDSECTELDEGEGFTHSFGHAGKFDGLVRC